MKPRADRDIIVFDVDGTLANDSMRCADIAPWKHRGTPEADQKWEEFYAAAWNDPPHLDAFNLADVFDEIGFKLICATGMPERFRTMRTEWLRYHEFPKANEALTLRMRANSDRSANPTLKQKMAKQIGPERIALWIDDHPGVAVMLGEIGVPVLSVDSGHS